MSYLGKTLDVAQCLLDLELAASRVGFDGELLFEIGNFFVPVLSRAGKSPDAPRIYLSAGIHGDEPAGPLAILKLLQDNALSDAFHWTLVPILNPIGLAAGTRESGDLIDLNRDFMAPKSLEVTTLTNFIRLQPQWNLSIMLHEDWEAEGFYLYTDTSHAADSLGRDMLNYLSEEVCPVDQRPKIDGLPAADGLMGADFDHPAVQRALKGRWPEALFFHQGNYSQSQFTLEAPSAFGLKTRIDVLCSAVLYLQKHRFGQAR